MHKRILVPVDLDIPEKLTKALEVAAQMAKDSDATIVYTAVVDAVPTMSKTTEGERMRERLRTFVSEQTERHGIKATDHVALRGDLHLNVGTDIIQTATETECDVIVMASHVPGLKEHFLASNAGHVASHAPISVYVVR